MKIKIDVLQSDIDDADASGVQGARCNPEACPINRAARRAFGVETRCFRPYIAVGDSESLAWLPPEAKDRLYAYDMGRGMTPFGFEVDAPKDYAPPNSSLRPA